MCRYSSEQPLHPSLYTCTLTLQHTNKERGQLGKKNMLKSAVKLFQKGIRSQKSKKIHLEKMDLVDDTTLGVLCFHAYFRLG